jgi:hypothetical protein
MASTPLVKRLRQHRQGPRRASPEAKRRAMTAKCRGASRALLVSALGTLYVVWGSTDLAIAVLVESVPPLAGAGGRFVIAGSLLGGLLVLRRGWRRFAVRWNELGAAVAVSILTLYAPSSEGGAAVLLGRPGSSPADGATQRLSSRPQARSGGTTSTPSAPLIRGTLLPATSCPCTRWMV